MSDYQSKNTPTAPKNSRVAIIRGEFNDELVCEIVKNSIQGFNACSIEEKNIDIFTVPGALEIPAMIKYLQKKNIYNGFLAIGVVIRGGTNHYEIVTEQASRGIMDCSLSSSIPIINGVLGGENIAQIRERLSKGKTFASGLVTMMLLMK